MGISVCLTQIHSKPPVMEGILYRRCAQHVARIFRIVF